MRETPAPASEKTQSGFMLPDSGGFRHAGLRFFYPNPAALSIPGRRAASFRHIDNLAFFGAAKRRDAGFQDRAAFFRRGVYAAGVAADSSAIRRGILIIIAMLDATPRFVSPKDGTGRKKKNSAGLAVRTCRP